MKKKLLLQFLIASLIVAGISCSSNKEDSAESADVAEATTPEGDPAAASADPADQAAADQAALDQAAPPADGMAPTEDPTQQPPADGAMAATEPIPGEAPADPTAAPPTDTQAATEPAPAPADGSIPQEAPPPADTGSGDLFGGAAAATTAEEPAPKPKRAKLAHIKDAPFTKGGQNLNTVYIAREGDSLDSVSQKLFGEDRASAFKKANPNIKKGVKTGDKIYFNSPNRPDDKERMLTVYEDQGLPPSTYTTKEGDTLKSLSLEWYGTEDSYKEIYAINKNVTSTKDLPAGTELIYWPAAATVASYSVAPPPAQEVAQATPPPLAIPEPTPAAIATPPPAMGTVDNLGQGQPPSIPPPPGDLTVPPPPPPISSKKKKEKESLMNNDTAMIAAGAGVVVVGLGLIVAIRRRRRGQGLTQV